MDKYAEIEKLGDLVQKGLLTESEYQVEKLKLLNEKNDNQSSDTSISITDDELRRIISRIRKLRFPKRWHRNMNLFLFTGTCSLVYFCYQSKTKSGNLNNSAASWAIMMFLVLLTSLLIRIMRINRYAENEDEAKALQLSLMHRQNILHKNLVSPQPFAIRHALRLSLFWLGTVILAVSSQNLIYGIPMLLMTAYLGYNWVHKLQLPVFQLIFKKFGTKGKWLCASGTWLFAMITCGAVIHGFGEKSEKPSSQKQSQSRNKSNLESPEDQFRRARKSELDPRMKIGNIVMNVKRENGNEVSYGGYYTLMFDEQQGVIGNKPEIFFFHALYRDGRFVGWNPDSNQ